MRHSRIIWVVMFAIACGDDKEPNTPAPTAVTTALQRRLRGDRTGACAAAAIVDPTSKTYGAACADVGRKVDENSVFEIGSISKTMTGFLTMRLVEQGYWSLSDPLQSYLPEGTDMPTFNGEPILIKHIVTHTSGLPRQPSRVAIADDANPYANVTRAAVLESLQDVELTEAPGTTWSYSNFGMMLLTLAIADANRTTLEASLQAALFSPLHMNHTSISADPIDAHLPNGDVVPAWDFPDPIGGIGGVKSPIVDMASYAQAALGVGDAAAVATVRRTLNPILTSEDGQTMGAAWAIINVNGRDLAAHDGGTGGFSSIVIVDATKRRAVVLMVDTKFESIIDFPQIALHLLDAELADLPPPHIEAAPPQDICLALAGDYNLGGQPVQLIARSGTIVADLGAGLEVTFGYDNYEQFFAREIDGVLTPLILPDGTVTFQWSLGGQVITAERL